MSVLTINTSDILDLQHEAHYQFLSNIRSEDYPQVHDFHEIVLVTQGSLIYSGNGVEKQLNQGDLQWACPGIVHIKKNLGLCQHINIAFPCSSVDELFSYLGISDDQQRWWQETGLHGVHLSVDQMLRMKNLMQQLSFIHLSKPDIVRTKLRLILVEVFTGYLSPGIFTEQLNHAPKWLEDLLKWLDNSDNLTISVSELATHSGFTLEHFIRVFKRVMNTTPSRFIRAKRLNYAANMLLHSDLSVIDIAFQSGFQSLGPFYAAFKSAYGKTPLQYRKVEATK